MKKQSANLLFSYVVDHDTGEAPNPYFGLCTLCLCKHRESWNKPKNVVELAEKGDWVIGTGGSDLRKSAGHGKLIYAMKVTNKLTLGQYYNKTRYKLKKPRPNGRAGWRYGDNLPPSSPFDRDQRFVLISDHFYYFGRNAISIPLSRFPRLEKRGRGFKSRFSEDYIARFVKWIDEESGYKPGKHGEPCKEMEVDDASSSECSPACPEQTCKRKIESRAKATRRHC